MLDSFSALLEAGSPLAFPLAFLAGIVTSLGPCAGARFFAVGSFAARSRRPYIVALVFIAGLVSAHLPIGIGAWVFHAAMFRWFGWASTYLNVAMATFLICAGAWMVVRARAAGHDHDDVHRTRPAADAPRSLAAVFVLGAAFAVALGPCCAPPIGIILASTTWAGKPVLGTLLLMVFGAGHAVPIFALQPFSQPIFRLAERFALQQVVAVVSGAVLIWLGSVYALCV